MTAPRDTRFAGFAKLVVEDLRTHGAFPMRPLNRSEARPLMEKIIAERAYDLVNHALAYVAPIDLDRLSPEEQVARIPDLTEWPEGSDG